MDMLKMLDASLKGEEIPSRPSPRARPATTVSRPSPTSSSGSTFTGIRDTLNTMQRRDAARISEAPAEAAGGNDMFGGLLSGMKKEEARSAMEQQANRKWQTGDVYSTHDLGPREGQRWSEMKRKPQRDVFEMLGQNPMKFYKVHLNPFSTPSLQLSPDQTC
jgi:hypothetical protein